MLEKNVEKRRNRNTQRDRRRLEWKIGSTQAQELPHSSIRGVTTPFRFIRRPDANVCVGRATFFYLTQNSCAVRDKIAWNEKKLRKNRCEGTMIIEN